MSEKISNLYAARIFAEHPIALWALDDNFDYISKLSVFYKNFSNWTLDNLEEVDAPIPENLVIPEEFAGVFTISSASANLFGSASSIAINTLNDLDPDKKTLSINAFVYDFEGFIESFDIGFIVNGSASFSNFANIGLRDWNKINHTIEVPEDDLDIYPFIKVNYDDPQVESGEQFNFAINAISVGQWSELFHYENTGVLSETIDNEEIMFIIENQTSLSASDISAVVADSYGIADPLNGYYLLEKNRMLSTNNRLPMTFGATNITNIKYPLYGNIPSLVFPAVGFLNEGGRYNELTAEFWLRCYTDVKTPLKIFGPISSGDGLYIEKDFITIKIGPYRQSYFVGKWYRPMLIDFRYSLENVSLLINGDLVIQLTIDQNKIEFPDLTKDYVGFFGNENIYPFDVDAFAIYPYLVQEQVAKRRFIYAKGVDSADNIASNFKGDSFTAEFPFAKYTTTLNYPDMTDWNAGFFLNANSTSRFLTLPDYVEPQIIFDQEVDIDTFLADNYQIQGSDYPFIKLKPNSNYDSIVSSIYFRSLNVLNEPVKSVFAIFRAPENLGAEKEVLMLFTNNFNNNTFSVKLSEAGLEYFYNNTLLYFSGVEESTIFVAGFDLDLISAEYRSILGNFFSNPQNLSFSLGGDQQSVFSGNIYKINFNDKFFTDKDIKEYIEDNGFIDSNLEPDILLGYVGNYTYYPQVLSDSLILDIGSSGYWEDSIPLSYFGKNVQDRLNNSYYDLDLIQFNLEIPSPLVLKKDEYYVLDGGLSSTLDFELYFDSGKPETESFLLTFDGGEPFTTEFVEFLTSEELEIAYGNFSPPDYTVKTYMTIQEKNEVGNIPYSQYVNTQRIGADRVLDFDNVLNFRSTKYEITDNTIIFPPKEQVNFEDYYITVHIELQTKGIKRNPLKVRRMSFASLAYDESTFYSLNSPNGYKMFPFSRSESTYIFKEKNPFVFYKDTSSYMYKTADSGVSVLPYDSSAPTRGLTIPINQQIAEEYLLGGVQIWGFYNKDELIKETIKIGLISTPNKKYDIVLIPEENNLRGRIEIFDSNTQNKSEGITFYQNGNIVDNPHIEPLSWNSFIFTFDESLVLNNRVGQFEIYEGMMVNNIAFYRKATDILGTTLTDKIWQEVRGESVWGTWLETNIRTEDIYVWDEVNDKFIVETFSVDGKAIYETTFGLATAILRDDTKIFLGSDGVKVVTGTIWDQFADRAV
jgi:hypothetical protein